MKTKPFLLHTLSPLHAGTGHSAGIIDLPTARMKATGIPFLPGSSIKGVLRDARKDAAPDTLLAVFGPEKNEADTHAGAVVVSDARLLALPVRSFKGTFAWVTSPLLLSLAKRDLEAPALPIPSIDGIGARLTLRNACEHNGKIYLQDLDLPATNSREAAEWAERLWPLASPGEDIFTKRFAIVDDDTMAFLWETAMQVDARVSLDHETRTVAPGALWLEESLPPETLLVGVLAAENSRRRNVTMAPDDVLGFALPHEQVHQFGGKATIGRGRCRIVPLAKDGVAHDHN